MWNARGETAAKPATKKARSATVGGRSDMVMTPDLLAFQIVNHFLPLITGRVLEPCAGDGAFVRAFTANGLTDIVELELTRGQDFFEYQRLTSLATTARAAMQS